MLAFRAQCSLTLMFQFQIFHLLQLFVLYKLHKYNYLNQIKFNSQLRYIQHVVVIAIKGLAILNALNIAIPFVYCKTTSLSSTHIQQHFSHVMFSKLVKPISRSPTFRMKPLLFSISLNFDNFNHQLFQMAIVTHVVEKKRSPFSGNVLNIHLLYSTLCCNSDDKRMVASMEKI